MLADVVRGVRCSQVLQLKADTRVAKLEKQITEMEK